MDFRSAVDQVKQFFVIGKDNPYLHGRQGNRSQAQGYEPEAYQPPQQTYAPAPGGQPYPQQGAYQPQIYQQQGAAAPRQESYQQAYQQPQPVFQQGYQPPQQAAYQAPQEPAGYQTQFSPDPYQAGARNRRAAQHQEQPQYQQAPFAAPQAAPENLVPFPGTVAAPEQKAVDAYVINVFNIASCRQAMTCLRRGQCTLIVMDQLIDKSEIRRFVDMLTGACYALGGTMTRLSAKIGFYIMAPSGMTVYTDPTTSNANAQPRPAQAPLYRPAQPLQGVGSYAPAAPMGFQPRQGEAEAPQEAPAGFQPYPEQRYAQ
ncbi:MAG: cell division protein SepF [Christensenellales bacterium]